MPRIPSRGPRAFALFAALLVQAAGWPAAPAFAQGQQPIGLMGTIPLYWGEGTEIGELVNGTGGTHWARPVLERYGALRPLPRLDGGALDGLTRLVLAQPRGLAPAENVALDTWVRGGGTLLLFADPMLTGESRFGIGDPRRPQDVVLLSPILRRWGLDLQFDESAGEGVDLREFAGKPLPVNLPGRFADLPDDSQCRLEVAGILASCTIGAGRVLVLADAALLDLHEPHPAAEAALDTLLARAFPLPERAENSANLPVPAGIYPRESKSGEPPG